MTRDRVDALDERVRGVRAAVERLDEKHATVREQLQALEAAVDGVPSPDSSSTPRSVLAECTSTETEQTEATDEDVAAAVRAVEAHRSQDG